MFENVFKRSLKSFLFSYSKSNIFFNIGSNLANSEFLIYEKYFSKVSGLSSRSSPLLNYNLITISGLVKIIYIKTIPSEKTSSF